MLKATITIGMLLLLSACAVPTTKPSGANAAAVLAEQREQARLVVSTYKRDAERVYGLAYPIFQAAGDICPKKVGPSLGMVDVDSLETVPINFKDAAQSELGLANRVRFTYVHSDSPAAKAGLLAGDELIALNGKPIPEGKQGLRAYVKGHGALKAGESVQLTVRRGIEQRTLNVHPETLPRIGINYDVFSSDVNAFADGTTVNFSRGLLRAMPTDDALTMVISHELAHNCQGHIEAQQTNSNIGLLFDVLAAAYGVNTQGGFSNIGAKAYSQDFEREADYVGLYYIARAGLPTNESRDAFRLLTLETGSSLTAAYGATHPSNPERFVRMMSAESEIQAKRTAGQPLVPESKKNSAQVQKITAAVTAPVSAPTLAVSKTITVEEMCDQVSKVDRLQCRGDLKLGMDKSEVEKLLGPPDARSPEGRGARYGDRSLTFDDAGRLIEIIAAPAPVTSTQAALP